MGDRRARPLREAWRHRRWRWLLTSTAVSLTGDFLYSVALVVFLVERTGSAAWVSAAVVARTVPYVVLGGVGGVLADQHPRRRLMFSLDVGRAGLLAVMALVAWTDGPVVIVVALAALASAATTPYRPAVVASTPVLVPEDDLAAANAAESILGQLAWFVGPALGAAVVAAADPGAAFALNAVTFAVAGALILRAGDLGGGRRKSANEGIPGDDLPAGLWSGVRDGVDVVRRDAGLRALTIFLAVVLFGFGVDQVVHVFVATRRLGLGPEGVGLLAAAIGVGGLVAAPLAARAGAGRHAGLLLAGTGVAVGVPLIGLALTTSTPVALLILAFEGAGGVVFEVLSLTLLQRACREELLARVFGLQDSLNAAAQLAGSMLAPILITVASLETALWVGGAVVAAASLAVAPGLHAMAVATDDRRRALAPTVELLAGLGIFGDAPRPALERLAEAARTRDVGGGQAVFHQGDPADDLYVVLAGELVVRTSGEAAGPVREVDRLEPGDWFGEIGLLRRAARTATVVAATDSRLLAVPGPVFLDALSRSEVLADPLRRTMTQRLVRTHPHLAEAAES